MKRYKSNNPHIYIYIGQWSLNSKFRDTFSHLFLRSIFTCVCVCLVCMKVCVCVRVLHIVCVIVYIVSIICTLSAYTKIEHVDLIYSIVMIFGASVDRFYENENEYENEIECP